MAFCVNKFLPNDYSLKQAYVLQKLQLLHSRNPFNRPPPISQIRSLSCLQTSQQSKTQNNRGYFLTLQELQGYPSVYLYFQLIITLDSKKIISPFICRLFICTSVLHSKTKGENIDLLWNEAMLINLNT